MRDLLLVILPASANPLVRVQSIDPSVARRISLAREDVAALAVRHADAQRRNLLALSRRQARRDLVAGVDAADAGRGAWCRRNSKGQLAVLSDSIGRDGRDGPVIRTSPSCKRQMKNERRSGPRARGAKIEGPANLPRAS
jgi:hypothetical protein